MCIFPGRGKFASVRKAWRLCEEEEEDPTNRSTDLLDDKGQPPSPTAPLPSQRQPSSSSNTSSTTKIHSDPTISSSKSCRTSIASTPFSNTSPTPKAAKEELYAAKYQRKQRRGVNARHAILHEAAVLYLLRHETHIVQLRGLYETQSEMILLLEL